jgi:mannose-6-phosphate isomerase-like protein (cupin superfamily)
MLTRAWRNHKGTLAAALVALALAAGWAAREVAHAADKAKFIKSETITANEVKLADQVYQNKPTGQAGVYFQGKTPGTRSFITGRFILKPGTEPHPIHQHVDEEIMIVTRGKGEISCAGKTRAVAAGSVMYTAPNVKHGITNTGKEPLEFYFIKWIGIGYREENGK